MKLYALVYKTESTGRDIVQHTWVVEETCDRKVEEWNRRATTKARKVVFEAKGDK